MSNNTDKKVEKVEKAKITVYENEVFKGDIKTDIVSSIEMAEIVSGLFSGILSDYYGCNVRINDGQTANPVVASSMPIGAIYVDLFFKDQGEAFEGAYKNIVAKNHDEAGRAKEDIASRFMRVNGAMNNSRMYTVTKETYEILEEFMFVNRVRWAEHTQEIASVMSAYGKEEVVVCISGLDLNKIITKIYGGQTEDGIYEYSVTPSTIIPSKSREFIMQVCQLDVATVRRLQNNLGIYSANAPQFHKYYGKR